MNVTTRNQQIFTMTEIAKCLTLVPIMLFTQLKIDKPCTFKKKFKNVSALNEQLTRIKDY